MKASNIFQKLKSAGVGNPDGVPSSKPKLKLGSPAKMAKKSPLKAMEPPTPKNQQKDVKPKSLSPYEKALGNNPDLPNLIKKRKGLDKSSNEYKKIQNAINKAYGVSKRYELTPENNTPAETPAADTPKIDKVNQAPKVKEAKANVQEAKTNVQNTRAEVAETNKQARKTRRAEKKAARIQKRADRKNARAERIKAEGGTRVGNFLRGKKKQEDAGGESPATMKKGSAMKMSHGKKSPTKFNAKLKKAAAEGKIKGKFKEVVEKAPTKMMKKGSPAKIAPALAAVGKKILVNAVAKKAASAMKMKKGAAMKMKYKK